MCSFPILKGFPSENANHAQRREFEFGPDSYRDVAWYLPLTELRRFALLILQLNNENWKSSTGTEMWSSSNNSPVHCFFNHAHGVFDVHLHK